MNIITISKVAAFVGITIATSLSTVLIESKKKDIVKKETFRQKEVEDDPRTVIQGWTNNKTKQKKEEPEVIMEDEEIEDLVDDDEDEDDEDLDVEEFLDKNIPDEGLYVMHPVEEEDDNDEEEDFDYHIPNSYKIKSLSGVTVDYDDVIELIRDAKAQYQKFFSGEDEFLEGMEVITEKELNETLSGDIPTPKKGMNVMDYLYECDPYNVSNRKLIFGDNAPGRNPLYVPIKDIMTQSKKDDEHEEEVVEEEKVSVEGENDDESDEITDDEIKEIDDLTDKIRVIMEKLFNNRETSQMYSGYIVNCRTACENGYEEIEPVMDRFANLINTCYDSLQRNQKFNRRTWLNRFVKIFHQANQVVKSHEGDDSLDEKH